jgi:hypothetical protein
MFWMKMYPPATKRSIACWAAGLPSGSSTLLLGPAGIGKSSVALQLAVAAAERGHRAALFTFDETVKILRTRSSSACRLTSTSTLGLISVQQVDPAELSPGEFVTILRQAVEGTDKSGRQAKVVLIDSLNGYLHSMPEEQFLNAQLHELFTYLNHRGVITLVTVTQSGMIGAAMQTPVDMTYLADNVILYGLGKGSTFTITLPTSGVRRERVAEPRRRETFAPSITSVSAPSIALSLAGLKVLVVDDEPDARGLVRRVLEDCEANVVTAGSVSEAIDQFRNSPPDVLVSDIGMPIEDGYALIRRVRAMK